MLNSNYLKKNLRLYFTKYQSIKKKKLKLLPVYKKLEPNYNLFFFFSNLFYYIFSIKLEILAANKTRSLSLTAKATYALESFVSSYTRSFKKDLNLFLFFSKFLFTFLFYKNLTHLQHFVTSLYSSLNRKAQFTLFKVLLCTTTFLKNFYLGKSGYKGIVYTIKGKLSWKALSRKKKTVYNGGKTSNYCLKSKVTLSKTDIRTVTGSVGLNLSLFY